VTAMKWTVVVTTDVPNLVVGSDLIENSALGVAAVLASDRGGVEREITLTVEADDEAGAADAAVEQLTSGVGGALGGVPEIVSMHIEPDEERA
jgi:hypothetical protein